MTPIALALTLVLAGPADDLVSLKVPPIKLSIPAAWTHKVEPGASHRFDAPSEDASFQLDVYPVKGKPMQPQECRDKLVKALGGEGWEKLTLGEAPAAKKTYADADPEKKIELETHSFVGCNGAVKWALTFTYDIKKRERFSALADRIATSVTYLKGVSAAR